MYGFTHNGQRFSLDAGDIESNFVGQSPDAIQKHWVELLGVRWPVNQAMRIAIGVQQPPVRSSAARRHFRGAGYQGGTATKAAASSARSRLDVAPVEVAELPLLDTIAASVSFTWRLAGTVTLDSRGVPRFPELPDVPGLYRFDFGRNEQGIRTLYIGEAKSIANRAGQYRRSRADGKRPNRTSRRMFKALIAHLSEGGRVDFAIATDVAVDGRPTPLTMKSVRLLAESAAVLSAQFDPSIIVLNIDAVLLIEE